LGGWMADAWGWRAGFLLYGGVGVAYAVVLMVALPTPPGWASPPRERGEGAGVSPPPAHAGGSPGPAAFVALLTAPGFLLLLGMNLLNGAAYWPVRNWLPTFFTEELGVGPK